MLSTDESAAAPPAPESESDTAEPQKRNSGRTGPTSAIGRAIAARNATRHGMCSKTLILDNESEEDWLELLAAWKNDYGQPAETTLLYTFVVKTAQSEWFRLRAQREYDLFFALQQGRPMFSWQLEQRKDHDLAMRYKTAAERSFQREYRLLEQHYKNHCKPDESETDETEADDKGPPLVFVNNETGEIMDCAGNLYPPPPGYVSTPIIPGKYGPKHPPNWKPPEKKKKSKRK